MTPPHAVLRLFSYLTHLRQMAAHRNARATQAALLRRILARYRDTEMGKAFDLGSVRDAEDFATRIPTRTTDDYLPWWGMVLRENRPNTVHPKPLKYMAKSSGTSGRSKYIPYPVEQMVMLKRFTTNAFFNVFRQLGDYSLLDANILINSGSAIEDFPETGITAALGSGLATLNPTRIAKHIIRPTPDVVMIPQWDEKIRATIEQCYDLDIRIMTGVPIAVVGLLEHLLEVSASRGRPARHAKDIWPHLRVYGYSGTSIDVFRDRIVRLLGPGVELYEIYSSTEAPVAYQHSFDRPGMLLDLTCTYFEFEPVGEGHTPGRRLRLHEVETGVPYDIVVTSPGGIFALALGDRVEFISLNPYVIRFAGRNIEEINLCTEHLRLDKVQETLQRVCALTGSSIRHFMLCPQMMEAGDEQRTGYEWCIEFENPPTDTVHFCSLLDSELQGLHDMYRAYRKSQLMKYPVLRVMPPGLIDKYVRQNIAFGQGKWKLLHEDRRLLESLMVLERSV